MTQQASFLRLISVPLVVGGLLLLSACRPAASEFTDSQGARQADGAAMQSVMIDSVNYMHERSTKYTLYDLAQAPMRAVGGAIVDRLATGGEKGCCLSLPVTWRPGLKVKLQWHESDRTTIYEDRFVELEIPKYAHPADLYVVFHPSHEVELVVSAVEPGHPDWPGRVKSTPWEHCLAQHERKVCKAALPKQFDTKSSQGFCTYTKSKDFPAENFDGEALCMAALHQCLVDYEDEPFCKNILWGERRP